MYVQLLRKRQRSPLWQIVTVFCLIACSGNAAATQGGWDCGDPFANKSKHLVDDYTEQSADVKYHLFLVQKTHFFDYFKKLSTTNLSDNDVMEILHNFDYTLRHFPNHHGALYGVSQMERRLGGKLPQKAFFQRGDWHRSLACYVERAMKFAPNDPGIYLVYAIHLHRQKNYKEAMELYKMSEEIKPDSMELQYNFGLLYFDLKEYDLSKKYAKRAYELGHQLPGLKRKLKRINKW